VRRRAAPTITTVVEGDDLGADWERWADGRAYRLKRKRHFADVDPGLARDAAEAAAARMGKAVRTTRDKMMPEKYMWVQFADHCVGPGEPCPCGSRRLLRLHEYFAACPECQAQLLLSDVPQDADNGVTRAARTLGELTEVHLVRAGPGQGRNLELYRGYGRQEGEPVFLLVDFRLKPDEELIEDEIFDRVVAVRVVPFSELSELLGVPSLDLSSLWGGRPPKWDFVW